MKNKGFTLIEVLIGLFIAVVASLYAASIITSSGKVAAAGRDTFIATNLAHEGVDLTRAMRENAWFEDTAPPHTDWMSKYGICPGTSTYTYKIDQTMVRLSQAVQSANNPALYIQGNGSWSHTVTANQTPTPYSRIVEADCTHVNGTGAADDPAYVTVTSEVSWTGKNGEAKSVELKEILYNWY